MLRQDIIFSVNPEGKTAFANVCWDSHRAGQLNAMLPVVAVASHVLVAHTEAYACRKEHSTGEDTQSQPQWQLHK